MPTPIANIGEFGLIKQITEGYQPVHPETVLGIGDDTAITQINPTDELLTTTDMLVEGIHFDLTYMPLKHLGYKAVVVNVSDIYSMNGTPKQITLSLAVSAKFSVEQIEELYEGVYTACKEYGVDLIGGDTCASLTGLCISVTCLGVAKKGKAIRRSGASANDLICVTGNLGAAYMGFMLLERERRVFQEMQDPDFTPDFSGYEYLIERQLKPEAQKHLAELLEAIDVVPTSMIDISDGLSSELLHLSKASQVGVKVYEEKIPIDYQTAALCEEMKISPTTAALNGGEDYEILFTAPITDLDKLSAVEGISVIGYATPEPTEHILVARDGTEITLLAQGWDAGKHMEK